MSWPKLLIAVLVYVVLLAALWILPQRFVEVIGPGLAYVGVGSQPGRAITGRDASKGLADDEFVLATDVVEYGQLGRSKHRVFRIGDGSVVLTRHVKSYTTERIGQFASLEELAAQRADLPAIDELTWVQPSFWSHWEGRKRLIIAGIATLVLLYLLWRTIRPAQAQPEQLPVQHPPDDEPPPPDPQAEAWTP